MPFVNGGEPVPEVPTWLSLAATVASLAEIRGRPPEIDVRPGDGTATGAQPGQSGLPVGTSGGSAP